MNQSMTVPKLRGIAMELEIKKLGKAVCDLTVAITALTVSLQAQKYNGNPPWPNKSFPIIHNYPIDAPNTICTDANCGVINSGTITCDHTLARYQSEYNCG